MELEFPVLTDDEKVFINEKMREFNRGKPAEYTLNELLQDWQKYVTWTTNLDEWEWGTLLSRWYMIQVIYDGAPESLKSKIEPIFKSISEVFRNNTEDVSWSWRPDQGDYWWLKRVPTSYADPTFGELLRRTEQHRLKNT